MGMAVCIGGEAIISGAPILSDIPARNDPAEDEFMSAGIIKRPVTDKAANTSSGVRKRLSSLNIRVFSCFFFSINGL